jgi:hypothetical protein
MTSDRSQRAVRGRSGLRPASAKQPREAAPESPESRGPDTSAGKQPAPRVPGEEGSKAPSKSRDARHPHDKDGNAEASAELASEKNAQR